MNHWPFIIAAYALTFVGTVTILVLSYLSMRRAEAALAELEKDK
jgi:hypothetical protein